MIKNTYHSFAKTFYLINLFFLCQIHTQLYANSTSQKSYELYTVFSSPQLRQEFSQFLTNVLQQTSPEKFYTIIDEILSDGRKKNDKKIYKKILEKINAIKPMIPLVAQFTSLQNQKNILGNQAEELLKYRKIIDGCVEIGTPGTYATVLAKNIPFTSKLYVVNEKRNWTDSFQAFSFNPIKNFTAYDSFIALNNYEPILKKDIPDNSVDLVICFIGLHHIPLEKINTFIASIRRILRPGGVFLLRDHDCQNSELNSIIFTAHSIYNALVIQETVENEQAEFRNFQKLGYWISHLESHGFETSSERLLQEGDPTLNTMVKFTKIATTEEEKLIGISTQLAQEENYMIDSIQTHLTSAEWFNVDASQEYGKFIEHTPFYAFPYLENISIYWKIFKNSWKVAQAKKGTLALIVSPYTLMSLFVGVSMTLEYAAKALISWPIKTWYNGEKPLPIKVLIKDPYNQINTIDSKITIVKEYPDSPFVLIEMPRNKDFFHIIEKIEHTDITLEEIAGQKEIQIKVLQPDEQKIPLLIHGCKQEYSWKVPTKPNHTFLALTVEIKKLKEIFKELREQGIQILHIHDF
jgi:SAM-dependent methyltransferase